MESTHSHLEAVKTPLKNSPVSRVPLCSWSCNVTITLDSILVAKFYHPKVMKK